ncbi:gephyrin-like molybdotransferase Glp [Candidatus Oleimmundimicrobium sp.]|uniref:molybdopterin molybdotransferase MoeA n=1 Tax=Candidatus Oleimmundimicrobium sp. TaxID=3060597 RepID=UPI002728CE76|nr:gephyrin-like molybdotransferase Glp [Candidatus Oleimmundimicrobium sp.]MDO8886886.1 molybdopterin molybdotransferase MoeA [Candidatus Oleimmundimicrobium sp.]
MIKPEEALKIILDEVRLQPVEKVNLMDSLGYVLAEDVVSDMNIPPFDNSAMDGFAIIASDTVGASKESPCKLKVLGDLKAGDVSDFQVTSGSALKIMTGAPVPQGADSVVKKEDTSLNNEEVLIYCEAKKGDNVRLTGEDVTEGEKVFPCGLDIRPQEIGLLASLGKSELKIFKPPTIAIISTGDELVEINEPLAPGKIRNSNTYSLTAQVISCGAKPVPLEVARDNMDATRKLIEKGLNISDILLTTGGVSMGDYDVVKDVLTGLGAELKFWKVAQKPGMPLAFWRLGDKLIFGLPGNPVSTVVCFEEYVRPAILKMMGKNHIFRPEVDAIFEHDLKKKPGRAFFVRVNVRRKNGEFYVSLTGPQGSGILKSMSLANGIAVIPAETTLVKTGDKVKVHLINLPEDH